jgi:hypothetical protein
MVQVNSCTASVPMVDAKVDAFNPLNVAQSLLLQVFQNLLGDRHHAFTRGGPNVPPDLVSLRLVHCSEPGLPSTDLTIFDAFLQSRTYV